jgi:hypothetical protein
MGDAASILKAANGHAHAAPAAAKLQKPLPPAPRPAVQQPIQSAAKSPVQPPVKPQPQPAARVAAPAVQKAPVPPIYPEDDFVEPERPAEPEGPRVPFGRGPKDKAFRETAEARVYSRVQKGGKNGAPANGNTKNAPPKNFVKPKGGKTFKGGR